MPLARMIHGLLKRMIVEAFKLLHLRWPDDAMQTDLEYKIRLSHDTMKVSLP